MNAPASRHRRPIWIVPGQPILLQITAQADSLLSGPITVENGSAPPIDYRIELPGGTSKELTVVGAPLWWTGNAYRVTLSDADGKQLVSSLLNSKLRPGSPVVGVTISPSTCRRWRCSGRARR